MREPMDLEAYEKRIRTGKCFICAFLAGDPEYAHELLYDDGEHAAFLSKYPTVHGYALVVPRAHVEQAVRDLSLDAYLRLQTVIHRVTLAIEAVVPSERTYVLSLGSQQANSHVHWHIAPLPPGTPFHEQQYHALMHENGVLPWTARDAAALGAKIRAAL